MVRILMVTDSYHMSGAFWRSTGPFLSLREICEIDITWIDKRQMSWAHMAEADIIFMHRPESDHDKGIFQAAKNLGKPIWVDYDDNLFEVPIDNGSHERYSDPKTQANMKFFLAMADQISVSTTTMKEALLKHTSELPIKIEDKIEILTNGFNPRWFQWRNIVERSKKVRVLWRGSKHHEKDLWHVNGHIKKAMREFPEVEFFFVGHKPWQLFEEANNWFHVGPMSPHQYMKTMFTIRPDICMVPLADNYFNKCKSNIAQLEGAMAGALSVVPNWSDVWDTTVGYAYNNANHFGECLMKALHNATTSRAAVNEAADQVWKAMMYKTGGGPYNLDVINLKRYQIIRKLSGLTPRLKMTGDVEIKAPSSEPIVPQEHSQESKSQAHPS